MRENKLEGAPSVDDRNENLEKKSTPASGARRWADLQSRLTAAQPAWGRPLRLSGLLRPAQTPPCFSTCAVCGNVLTMPAARSGSRPPGAPAGRITRQGGVATHIHNALGRRQPSAPANQRAIAPSAPMRACSMSAGPWPGQRRLRAAGSTKPLVGGTDRQSASLASSQTGCALQNQ